MGLFTDDPLLNLFRSKKAWDDWRKLEAWRIEEERLKKEGRPQTRKRVTISYEEYYKLEPGDFEHLLKSFGLVPPYAFVEDNHIDRYVTYEGGIVDLPIREVVFMSKRVYEAYAGNVWYWLRSQGRTDQELLEETPEGDWREVTVQIPKP